MLDQHFLGHAPERAIATDTTRALTEGTRALSAAERAALHGAVTTELRAAGGALPTFTRPSPRTQTRTGTGSATPSTQTSPRCTRSSSFHARRAPRPT
jgi:hypothetical protein